MAGGRYPPINRQRYGVLLHYNGSLKTDSQQVWCPLQANWLQVHELYAHQTTWTYILPGTTNLQIRAKSVLISDETSRSNAKKYRERATAESCFTWSTSEGNPCACWFSFGAEEHRTVVPQQLVGTQGRRCPQGLYGHIHVQQSRSNGSIHHRWHSCPLK